MQTDTAPRSRSKLDRMRPKDFDAGNWRVVAIKESSPRSTSSVPARLTRQGVPDMNGPKCNGTGYNGSRTVTCQHWRDPQSVATHIVETTVLGIDGTPETVEAVHCSACGHVMA